MSATKRMLEEKRDDLQDALDALLDIAEDFYPDYYSSDQIAMVLDTYKKYFD
jgi:uncharacterized protein YqeY